MTIGAQRQQAPTPADPAVWWATHYDQPAGHDRGALSAMAATAERMIGDVDAARALFTPAELREAGWDLPFGGTRDAWQRARREMLARLEKELTDDRD